MYESFYGLKEKPFSMLPDPGFLFLSKKHQMALTLLEYGLLNDAGFCVVSGETGSGKTTLLRKLLENIEDNFTVGMITNTHKGFGELLDWVLSAFDIHEQGMSSVEMHQRFMDFVVEQYAVNKTTLLIIDEAQNMTTEKLEELRMLSNVNSEKDQVLQVILAGQPELKSTLRSPELRQFAQRIAVDHHLGSLNEEETVGYINHRLSVAGAEREIFTEEACDRIYEYSGGTPRLINLLCDTVMVYGFADQGEVIDEGLVDEMVQERMQDSIVPLASVTPSSGKKKKNKKKKKKPTPEKVELVEESPVEDPQFQSKPQDEIDPEKEELAEELPVGEHQLQSEPQGEVDSESDGTHAFTEAMEETPDKEELKAEESKKNTYGEAVESIEQMASESVAFDSSEKQTTEKEEQPQLERRHETDRRHLLEGEDDGDGDGGVRRRAPNTIVVLEPEEAPETKIWKWVAAAVVLIAIGVFVFIIGTSDPDDAVNKKVASTQPAPVVQAVPDKIKRQLEEAEKFRKELARRQEEDRVRMQALEEQAALMQRERDEALAKAESEEKKRAKALAKARKAAKNEKQAQEVAKKEAIAAALAAERKNQVLVKLQAEDAARLEQELLKQREMLRAEEEARAQAEAKPEPEPVIEAKTKDESFNTDPCASSTARFLSTCR
jgi:general secretion pathway protein A